MTLKELITKAAEKEPRAQAELFNQLGGIVAVVCRRKMRNQEDAEERALTAFHRFLDALPNFYYQSDGETVSFLKSIARQECNYHLRKKGFLNVVGDEELEEATFEYDMLSRLSLAEVMRIIDTLPDGYRNVINMYVFDGCDHKEISRILGISINTSRSQLSKARALIQKILNEKENNHERERSTELLEGEI